MTDPAIFVALGSSGLAGLAMVSAAFLKGWSNWLELKRMQLSAGGRDRTRNLPPELVELRLRVRKLEAIASGEH